MHDEDPDSNSLSACVDSEPTDSSSATRETHYIIIPAGPDNPPPEVKRYAHHGKRRRSYTEELIRCQHVKTILKDTLVCGALIWKTKPQELRAHLLEHYSLDFVHSLTDDQVLGEYAKATRIFLESIPDDKIYGLDETDLDEDDELDIQEGDPANGD